MRSRLFQTTLAALGSAALLTAAGPAASANDFYRPDGIGHRHHSRVHRGPFADQETDQRYDPGYGGPAPRPGRTGYVVNRQGFGNYVRGPDGSFGGYPLNSPGAQILQRQQEKKCQNVPESC